MKIAGYSNISATANCVTIKHGGASNDKIRPPAHRHHTKSIPKAISKSNAYRRKRFKVYNNTMYVPTEAEVISEKKIYIPVYLNKFRIVGCVDSGSDLTLMHDSLFKRIKQRHQTLNTSDIPFITTFSDNNVKVKGKLPSTLLLNQNHPGIPIDIYVITDIPNQTPFLLGNDLLRVGLGQISYVDSFNGPVPEIVFKYPVTYKCSVYYTAPRELFNCTAEYSLKPFETQDVEFELPSAAPVIRKDHILITAQYLRLINIIPSRSDLDYIPSK